MSLETVARRYAIALADVVIPRRETEAVQKELLQWGSMISTNPLLREVFSNPTVSYEQKQKLLRELITQEQGAANHVQSASGAATQPAVK